VEAILMSSSPDLSSTTSMSITAGQNKKILTMYLEGDTRLLNSFCEEKDKPRSLAIPGRYVMADVVFGFGSYK
jgi:hypothetical protein